MTFLFETGILQWLRTSLETLELGWPNLRCQRVWELVLVHALVEEVVFTSELKLFTESETKQEAELAAIESWSWIFGNTYNLSDPSEPWSKISLASYDFIRQWLGCNSKNTALSSANLLTLVKFLVIVGTCKRWFVTSHFS